MPTATIETIRCVRSASGIDGGVFDAIATLPVEIAPGGLDEAIAAIRALPGVIEAIDAARDDPDNLYITSGTTGKRDQALWPEMGTDVDMRPDQSATPGIAIEFDFTQNLSLWDHDTVSRDDHLGSITIDASEAGQGAMARLASSSIEGSAYYITYRVE